jgi:hypothetical protein
VISLSLQPSLPILSVSSSLSTRNDSDLLNKLSHHDEEELQKDGNLNEETISWTSEDEQQFQSLLRKKEAYEKCM